MQQPTTPKQAHNFHHQLIILDWSHQPTTPKQVDNFHFHRR